MKCSDCKHYRKLKRDISQKPAEGFCVNPLSKKIYVNGNDECNLPNAKPKNPRK